MYHFINISYNIFSIFYFYLIFIIKLINKILIIVTNYNIEKYTFI